MDGARSYWCYKCQHMVLVMASDSPGSNLSCPCCGDGFLEQAGVSSPVPAAPGYLTPGPAPVYDILDAMAAAVRRHGGSNLLWDRAYEPYRGGNIYVLRGGEAQPRWFNFGGSGGSVVADRRGLERLIQQLMEIEGGGNTGTPPASRTDVDSLPTITISREHLSSGNEENSCCAICKEDFAVGNKARQLPCRHLYHQDCILPWLSLHGSCPVCRYEFGSGASGGGVGGGASGGGGGGGSSSRRPSSSSGRSGGFFSWPFGRRRS